MKLGLYIIQNVTITDVHFKRTNASMFDKNYEMLVNILFPKKYVVICYWIGVPRYTPRTSYTIFNLNVLGVSVTHRGRSD